MSAFSVASFNILADSYAAPHYFSYCDAEALTWPVRSKEIARVLKELNADIYCLQEVDHFEHFFASFFRIMKYEVAFVKRTGPKADGCLIAWRTSKFTLRRPVEAVAYNDIARGMHTSFQVRMKRENVGQFVVLESIDHPGKQVIVANTHLYWNPQHEDVKLRQILYLLQRLETVIQTEGLRNCPVVLCGDLNSLPSSWVYGLLNEGTLDARTHQQPLGTPRLLLDTDLNKVARWLRSVGVDAAFFVKEQNGGHEVLFDLAIREKRILLTRSKGLLQRRRCPPSFLVTELDSDLAFEQIICHFGLAFDPETFYTRCTLCNGEFETLSLEEVQKYPEVPEKLRSGVDEMGRVMEYFHCVNPACSQVYWWSTRSEEAAAKFKAIFDRAYARHDPPSAQPSQESNSEKSDTSGTVEAPSDSSTISSASGSAGAVTDSVLIVPEDEMAALTVEHTRIGPRPTLDSSHDNNSTTVSAPDPAARGDEEKKSVVPSRLVSTDPAAPPTAPDIFSQVLSHNLGLRSAYLDFTQVEPEATNITGGFTGCLDYIFFSKSALKVVDVLSIPPSAELIERYGGFLPNPRFPSDHLALRAHFEFINAK